MCFDLLVDQHAVEKLGLGVYAGLIYLTLTIYDSEDGSETDELPPVCFDLSGSACSRKVSYSEIMLCVCEILCFYRETEEKADVFTSVVTTKHIILQHQLLVLESRHEKNKQRIGTIKTKTQCS